MSTITIRILSLLFFSLFSICVLGQNTITSHRCPTAAEIDAWRNSDARGSLMLPNGQRYLMTMYKMKVSDTSLLWEITVKPNGEDFFVTKLGCPINVKNDMSVLTDSGDCKVLKTYALYEKIKKFGVYAYVGTVTQEIKLSPVTQEEYQKNRRKKAERERQQEEEIRSLAS